MICQLGVYILCS